MKKFKYLIAVAAAALLGTACTDKLETYEGVDNIYFSFANLNGSSGGLGANDGLACDSLSTSLAERNGVMPERIIEIPVTTMSKPKDFARKISAQSVAGDRFTAVEGRDYEILDSEIPAGASSGSLRIKLISSAELTAASNDNTPGAEKGLRLKVRLLPNENFKTDYTVLNDKAATTDEVRKGGVTTVIEGEGADAVVKRYPYTYDMNALNYKVFFHNAFALPYYYVQANYSGLPTQYNTVIGYLGAFSTKKIEFFEETLKLGEDIWYPDPAAVEKFFTDNNPRNNCAPGYWVMMKIINMNGPVSTNLLIINRTLEAYKKVHGEYPKDENGNDITLGPNGQKMI